MAGLGSITRVQSPEVSTPLDSILDHGQRYKNPGAVYGIVGHELSVAGVLREDECHDLSGVCPYAGGIPDIQVGLVIRKRVGSDGLEVGRHSDIAVWHHKHCGCGKQPARVDRVRLAIGRVNSDNSY